MIRTEQIKPRKRGDDDLSEKLIKSIMEIDDKGVYDKFLDEICQRTEQRLKELAKTNSVFRSEIPELLHTSKEKFLENQEIHKDSVKLYDTLKDYHQKQLQFNQKADEYSTKYDNLLKLYEKEREECEQLKLENNGLGSELSEKQTIEKKFFDLLRRSVDVKYIPKEQKKTQNDNHD